MQQLLDCVLRLSFDLVFVFVFVCGICNIWVSCGVHPFCLHWLSVVMLSVDSGENRDKDTGSSNAGDVANRNEGEKERKRFLVFVASTADACRSSSCHPLTILPVSP